MAVYIGRQNFIAAFGSAAVAWPLAMRTQQQAHGLKFLDNLRSFVDAVTE